MPLALTRRSFLAARRAYCRSLNASSIRLPRRCNRAIHLLSMVYAGVFLGCILCARPSAATILWKMPGDEQRNVSRFIAIGTTPIDIRVTAIRDRELIRAILKGSRTRFINVLIDDASPEIRNLVGHKNVRVHITAGNRKRKFGPDKLSYSFVLEIGIRGYQEWFGPVIWTRSAFGRVTQFIAGSGDGPGEPWPQEAQTFDHDFFGSISGGSVTGR